MSESTTYALRQRLIDIAARDVGKVESSYNQGTHIKTYWPATSYPEGYRDKAPYCAAAVCKWVQEWLQDPEVLAALGKTPAKAEAWRCKSAAAFGWKKWAQDKGVKIFTDAPGVDLRAGDIMVFDMSHIGLVVGDGNAGNIIKTIEANTSDGNDRDGKYVAARKRARSLALCFIRMME
jgi:hypothetical protein